VDYFDVLSGYSDEDSERPDEESVHGQPVTPGSAFSLRIKATNITIAIACSANITTNWYVLFFEQHRSLDACRSSVSRIFARIIRNPNSQDHTSGTYFEEGECTSHHHINIM